MPRLLGGPAPVMFSLAVVCVWAQSETAVVRPREIHDVLVNPGMGITTFQRFNGDALNEGTKWTEGYPIAYQPFHGSLLVPNQPLTSIAYFRVYWKFIEPEMGKYRWDLLDQALKTRKYVAVLGVKPFTTEQEAKHWANGQTSEP